MRVQPYKWLARGLAGNSKAPPTVLNTLFLDNSIGPQVSDQVDDSPGTTDQADDSLATTEVQVPNLSVIY